MVLIKLVPLGESQLRIFCILIFFWVFSDSPSAQAMTFRIEPQTREAVLLRGILDNGTFNVLAEGQIESNTVEVFNVFLAENSIISARIFLSSNGGSLYGGIKLGEEIRKRGYPTTVGFGPFRNTLTGSIAVCASACVYAFVGGHNRHLVDTDGRLGVHQFSTTSNVGDLGSIQLATAKIIDYLSRMGVDAQAYVLAAKVPRTEILWMDQATSLRFNLSNNGIHPVEFELRLLEGEPYLRLQQERNDVLGRAVLFCRSGQGKLMVGLISSVDAIEGMDTTEAIEKNYFQFDDLVVAPLAGNQGVSATNGTLWVSRSISVRIISNLMSASSLSAWRDGHGAMRHGVTIDLKKARPTIISYMERCIVR